MRMVKKPEGVEAASLRFGQRPRPRVTVNPPDGFPGTLFVFNAVGFDSGAVLHVRIFNAVGRAVYNDYVTADAEGDIGAGKLHWETEGSPTGTCRFWVSGTYEGQEVIRERDFRILNHTD